MIKYVLSLVRWKNLIFIALIMILMRFCIVETILKNRSLDFLFGNLNFILLILTVIFIAAAGYAINDYFDYESDFVDKKKNFVGTKLTKNFVFRFYIILNVLSLISGFYLSFAIDLYKIGFIFIISQGLLWLYSSSYKKMFLVGNLIIALLSAIVPFIIVLFEIPLQYSINADIIINQNSNLNEIIFITVGFSIFAFLFTLIREIIKDCEDINSDISANANTVPIILGQKGAKIITISLLILTIIGIFFTIFLYFNDILSIIYSIVFVVIPTLFLIYKIFLAKDAKDFHFLSTFTKIIMLAGVLYSIIVLINF